MRCRVKMGRQVIPESDDSFRKRIWARTWSLAFSVKLRGASGARLDQLGKSVDLIRYWIN